MNVWFSNVRIPTLKKFENKLKTKQMSNDVENFESIVKTISTGVDSKHYSDVHSYIERYRHHGFVWRESVDALALLFSALPSPTIAFDKLPLFMDVGIALLQLERTLQLNDVVPVVRRRNALQLLEFLEENEFLKDCGPYDSVDVVREEGLLFTQLTKSARVSLDRLTALANHVAKFNSDHTLWQTLVDAEKKRHTIEEQRKKNDNNQEAAPAVDESLLDLVKKVKTKKKIFFIEVMFYV